MKIVIVGAGNLATHISKALLSAGNEIMQVYSRTIESATVLASSLGTEAVCDVEDIAKDADLYVVSVTDIALETLIPPLCKGRENSVFAHTAGSMPMSVFEGCARHFGVIYPMQTFTKSRILDFNKIPCFVEASDEPTFVMLRTLCLTISSRVIPLSSDDRKYLHLAAVFASNFVNHCYNMTSSILRNHGLDFDVMYPLIDEVAAKIHEMTPAEAQTGPALRYDRNVMDKQISLLECQPEVQEVYEIMSRGIHKMHKEYDKL